MIMIMLKHMLFFRMSPNATDSSTILREERKIPNGCANGWPSVSDTTDEKCWKNQAFIKIKEIVALIKHYCLRAYVIFWREYTFLIVGIFEYYVMHF